ncbi:ribosomal protein L11 methyltransferase [Methanobrevibacter cuticularis]|uniref:Ribosomal protein L11 methyltransferase n=2 Tax=Methanobrevibacter cuticularis TaxID=47311 RepID=A0A166DT21_9EURY|nr:ribosomal protein L11 methyltransferase [Methanobrevibacter cuticularis]
MKMGEFEIETNNNVYEPSDDSFLLSENLIIEPDDIVLEIGTGTGIIAISASKLAKKVIATDINFDALELAEKNIKANDVGNITLLFGDLFEPVQNMKFDVILFNLPYLPTEECEILEDNLNYAFDGGLDGRKVINPFLNEVKSYLNEGGKVQLIQSSLSNIEETISKLRELGFKTEITAKERFFFEEIVLITGVLDR